MYTNVPSKCIIKIDNEDICGTTFCKKKGKVVSKILHFCGTTFCKKKGNVGPKVLHYWGTFFCNKKGNIGPKVLHISVRDL